MKKFLKILSITIVVTALSIGILKAFGKALELTEILFGNYDKQVITVSVTSDNKISKSDIEVAKNVIVSKFADEYRDKVFVSNKGNKKLKIFTHFIYSEQEINNILKTPTLEFKSEDYPIVISANDIKKAEITLDRGSNWGISIQFDKEGAKKFGDMTTEILGKPLGIYYNSELINAPIVKEPILGGKALITVGVEPVIRSEINEILNNIIFSYLNLKVDSVKEIEGMKDYIF